MAILLVKCDFSYSCAAADKISTDLRRRAVPLRQLSYLLIFVLQRHFCIGFPSVYIFLLTLYCAVVDIVDFI